uniref:Uncharacterized protein n=1 Tax=mine drainage metagenome TaxID=410659 RepID=E6QQP4_9ZZZZ
MSEAWKQLDLEGDGLQALSLKLAQQLKQRKRANLLLLAFPFGLHRDYLEHPLGAWLYRVALILAITAYVLHRSCLGSVLVVLMTAAALYDIRWIDDRVATLNKALRMAAYRNRPNRVPENFHGRYVDEGLDDYLKVKEQERGGHVPAGKDPAFNSNSRMPSFAQQEAMLKALAKQAPDSSDQ